jgi:hypothetical protein
MKSVQIYKMEGCMCTGFGGMCMCVYRYQFLVVHLESGAVPLLCLHPELRDLLWLQTRHWSCWKASIRKRAGIHRFN